ncbi:hypothetical protein GCM10011416_02970 [Polaribacter pacificus]|uniref:Uncharacterized protein n=1 Tax=Polaribacter pacificus TaxID=1775173 RepID=A0A917MBI9_9FLAO|nr:hypothetical protein [Polaribacter pacificus]GGG89850.1 hypothetical protein GCM10011416_02970 [Polaribacter pacificus]
MKKYITLVLVLFTAHVFAQSTVNNYKYVVVSDKFDFLKGTDKYQTSSLTKFLFNKYGFTAFLSSDVLPDDLNMNRCNALYAELTESSGFLRIRVNVVLKDCNNKVVYTSELGSSKEKEFKKAYHEAIREAFLSIEKLKYQYVPKPVAKDAVIAKVITKNLAVKKVDVVLAAKAIVNGYQLLDEASNSVFTVLKTNQPTVFILKGKNGLLYKGNDQLWIAEYYENDQLLVKKYQIKF